MIDDLPKGWELANINQISDLISGQHILTQNYNQKNQGIPYLTGPIDFKEKYPKISKWTESPKATSIKGDVLITVKGAGVGKTNILNHDRAAISRQLMAVRSTNIDNLFIFYYFKSNFDHFQKVGQGSTVPGIDRESILKTTIPIPPQKEQSRIASKIEELFTGLDAGIESLKKTQTLLKKYRQSVLKSAVEGKLTSEWRKQHKDEIEPADKLLESILKERKEKWEAEKLAEFKSKGKKPPKNWQSKYKEPSPPDTSDLPELPEGWVWSTIGQTSNINMGQSPPGSSYNFSGKGLALINGPVEFGPNPFSKTLKTKFTTESKKVCDENDLILCVRGSTTGRMNISGFKACIGRGVAAIKSFVHQPYLNYYIHMNEKMIFNLGTGSTFPNISLQTISDIPIPVPSLAEQKIIILKIEKLLSIVDELKSTIAEELRRSQSLKQSILKKAFEGKLVPQDPNDEPASVLLDRIKAENANLNN